MREKKTYRSKGKRGSGRERGVFKKGRCRFCLNKNMTIDYLDTQGLRRFTTERGKILPGRITGVCARHQRKLARTIKLARQAGLIQYVAE